MRFAIVDNTKVEAKTGMQAICSCCAQPVIAKCGNIKVHHWAHKSKINCDSWWEPETEWHRSWKNNYPKEWQECILPDEQTGEKHIADVRTEQGLVLEFQHSSIHNEERISRERFYLNMIWVVDGLRLKNDYKRFIKSTHNYHRIKKGLFRVDYPEDCFPNSWLRSSVPVVFDFQYLGAIDDFKDMGRYLYCLFPIKINDKAFVAEIPYKAFIKSTLNGEWGLRMNSFTSNLLKVKKEHAEKQAILEEQRKSLARQEFTNRVIYKRRRVF